MSHADIDPAVPLMYFAGQSAGQNAPRRQRPARRQRKGQAGRSGRPRGPRLRIGSKYRLKMQRYSSRLLSRLSGVSSYLKSPDHRGHRVEVPSQGGPLVGLQAGADAILRRGLKVDDATVSTRRGVLPATSSCHSRAQPLHPVGPRPVAHVSERPPPWRHSAPWRRQGNDTGGDSPTHSIGAEMEPPPHPPGQQGRALSVRRQCVASPRYLRPRHVGPTTPVHNPVALYAGGFTRRR